jgi:dihydroorotate dehydrogenase
LNPSAQHHARDCFRAGARLVQVYAGLVYRGPALLAA